MISFVIPTLNEEKTLEGTLENLSGYIGPHEIIVSDGRSRDRTLEIARRYADKLVVYEGTARQTIAMGRNAGAAIARGDFIVSLDADVTFPDINNFFAAALACFERDPRLVGLTAFYRVLPELATWADKLMFRLVGYQLWFLNNVFGSGGSGGEFQLVRAEAFKKIGGYNNSLVVSEDNDLFWRLAKIGRTRFEPSLFIYHPGRRAHQIGWPRLIWQWTINGLFAKFLNRSVTAEWTEVR